MQVKPPVPAGLRTTMPEMLRRRRSVRSAPTATACSIASRPITSEDRGGSLDAAETSTTTGASSMARCETRISTAPVPSPSTQRSLLCVPYVACSTRRRTEPSGTGESSKAPTGSETVRTESPGTGSPFASSSATKAPGIDSPVMASTTRPVRLSVTWASTAATRSRKRPRTAEPRVQHRFDGCAAGTARAFRRRQSDPALWGMVTAQGGSPGIARR
jgi:hypothetical protein